MTPRLGIDIRTRIVLVQQSGRDFVKSSILIGLGNGLVLFLSHSRGSLFTEAHFWKVDGTLFNQLAYD